MTRIPVVGLGAGGHAKVVLDILRLSKRYKVVGFIDKTTARSGSRFCDVPFMGSDRDLPALVRKGITHYFVGLGSIGDVQSRKRLYDRGLSAGLKPISAIHPSAIISSSVHIGMGATIMAGAIINAATRLGDDVIINTSAVIEHDCVLFDHVHVSPGALLAGGVTVNAHAHIGLGAIIKQGISIGRSALVAAGAVVISDVPDRVIVAGVPARVLKKQ